MKYTGVNCPVCHKTTQPHHIGTADYCTLCGNRYAGAPKPASASHPKQLDIAPSRTTKTAGDLHRGRARGVIDLRTHPAAKPANPAPQVERPAHHTTVTTPSPAAHERHTSTYNDRLASVKKISRSPLIARFGNRNRLTQEPATVAAGNAQSSDNQAPEPAQELPRHATTQHEAMTRLTHAAPAPATAKPANASRQPNAKWRPHLGLSPNKSRVATTAAAIVIMSSYIWLHNYPKLALQTANNQAGLVATLPGYLPSSYNLATTNSAPGLVTLDFTSPAMPDVLKIAQHRTSWDSNSLLDNYVAKQTDDYSTIHGQGLTIYMFGQNQAAWVNHGIWYSIDGATKLSREQILKIAYSL